MNRLTSLLCLFVILHTTMWAQDPGSAQRGSDILANAVRRMQERKLREQKQQQAGQSSPAPATAQPSQQPQPAPVSRPYYGFTSRPGPPAIQVTRQRQGNQLTISIRNIPIKPATLGQSQRLTDGQMAVAAQIIFDADADNSLQDSFLKRFASAATRTEQEEAILSFLSGEDRQKFLEMSKQESVTQKLTLKDFPPLENESEALAMAAVKQPFVDFPGWGHDPFGSPASSWEDLRDKLQDYMLMVIRGSNFPPDVLADWYDTLQGVLSAGPDNIHSAVVDIRKYPYWQWTAGKTLLQKPKAAQRLPGVNIHYVNGPAYGLAIVLQKSNMLVIHGFPCR